MGRQTDMLYAIDDRQRDAERKQLRQKGQLIATMLGTARHLDGKLGKISGVQLHVLELGLDVAYTLGLEWIAGVGSAPVLKLQIALGVNGHVVFSSDGQATTGYVPGVWEVAFEQLYARAQLTEEELKKSEGVREEQIQEDNGEYREKWGL